MLPAEDYLINILFQMYYRTSPETGRWDFLLSHFILITRVWRTSCILPSPSQLIMKVVSLMDNHGIIYDNYYVRDILENGCTTSDVHGSLG